MVRENVHQDSPERNKMSGFVKEEAYGIATVDKKGMMRKTLHKSLGCTRVGRAWVVIVNEEVADRMIRCKHCFRE